ARILEVNLRDHARLARVRNVEDRGTELRAVRQVTDVGVIAYDAHLPGARQVQTREALDVLGKRGLHAPDGISLRRAPGSWPGSSPALRSSPGHGRSRQECSSPAPVDRKGSALEPRLPNGPGRRAGRPGNA